MKKGRHRRFEEARALKQLTTDESPTVPLWNESQLRQKSAWEREIASLETTLKTPSSALLAGQARWEQSLENGPLWTTLKPSAVSAKSGAKLTVLDDRSVRAESKGKTDVTTVTIGMIENTSSNDACAPNARAAQ